MGESMSFTLDGDKFVLEGRNLFVCSGEIHYFRIPRENWEQHLLKLKEANCNTVSFYVPWCWHEYEDGICDLNGQSSPERDITAFLALCKKVGLFSIAKIGPYIFSEIYDLGIPDWLIKGHPEILAKNSGKPSLVSYLNPVFIKHVKRWYSNIMPLLLDSEIKNGGSLIMIQVCNEVGAYHWLTGEGDKNLVALAQYSVALREKYGLITKLNMAHGTKYRAFTDVEPPKGLAGDVCKFRQYADWQDHHRQIYKKYIEFLVLLCRKLGMTVPVFHNIAGWFNGRALDYPTNIGFYSHVKDKQFFYAHDHIPEYLSDRNSHDSHLCHKFLTARHGQGPSYIAELQAGTREYSVRPSILDLEAFYKMVLSHGIAGLNFYMFSQGRNQGDFGFYGNTFYWDTPLNFDGTENSLYPVVRRIGAFLKVFGELLLLTRDEADLAVNNYDPYYRTEFIQPMFGNSRVDYSRLGLKYDFRLSRNLFFFDGFLKSMVNMNKKFDVVDLGVTKELAGYRTLVAFSLECMDGATQDCLVRFVKNGGNLVIFPTIPSMNLEFKPCNSMAEKFAIQLGEYLPVSKVYYKGEFQGHVRDVQTFQVETAAHIANTDDGRCCGLVKRYGKGQITMLGFQLLCSSKNHVNVWNNVLSGAGDSREVKVDNPDIHFVFRKAGESGFLFLFNRSGISQKCRVQLAFQVAKDRNDEIVNVDRVVSVPPAGLILPVNVPIPGNISRLEFCGLDVIGLGASPDGISLSHYSAIPTFVETVIRTAKRPKNVRVGKKIIPFSFFDGKLEFSYTSPSEEYRVTVN